MDGWPFSSNNLSHAPPVIQIKEVIKKSQAREGERFVLASSSSAKSLSLHFLHFSAMHNSKNMKVDLYIFLQDRL